VDALEEVKVITGNGSSEFGNVGGAILNTTLKRIPGAALSRSAPATRWAGEIQTGLA
jgi:hypothetical protein